MISEAWFRRKPDIRSPVSPKSFSEHTFCLRWGHVRVRNLPVVAKMRFNQHPLLINTFLGEKNNPLFFFLLFSLVDMVSLTEIRFNLHPLLINIRGYRFCRILGPIRPRFWVLSKTFGRGFPSRDIFHNVWDRSATHVRTFSRPSVSSQAHKRTQVVLLRNSPFWIYFGSLWFIMVYYWFLFLALWFSIDFMVYYWFIMVFFVGSILGMLSGNLSGNLSLQTFWLDQDVRPNILVGHLRRVRPRCPTRGL